MKAEPSQPGKRLSHSKESSYSSREHAWSEGISKSPTAPSFDTTPAPPSHRRVQSQKPSGLPASGSAHMSAKSTKRKGAEALLDARHVHSVAAAAAAGGQRTPSHQSPYSTPATSQGFADKPVLASPATLNSNPHSTAMFGSRSAKSQRRSSATEATSHARSTLDARPIVGFHGVLAQMRVEQCLAAAAAAAAAADVNSRRIQSSWDADAAVQVPSCSDSHSCCKVLRHFTEEMASTLTQGAPQSY